MRHLLLRGALALVFACLFLGAPARAAEGCRPLEGLIAEAAAAEAAGYPVRILAGEDARRGFAVLIERVGAPPRPIEVSALILVRTESADIVVIGEGVLACFTVMRPPGFVLALLRAVEGDPA